jgi:hypothetical protein
LTVSQQGGEIIATICPCAATLTRTDIVMLAKILIDMVTGTWRPCPF